MCSLYIRCNSVRFLTQSTTEWQWPLSGVHSIIMEKLAQAGEEGGGGARPPPFTISTITYVQICGVRSS
jgi:hypothetical protein